MITTRTDKIYKEEIVGENGNKETDSVVCARLLTRGNKMAQLVVSFNSASCYSTDLDFEVNADMKAHPYLEVTSGGFILALVEGLEAAAACARNVYEAAKKDIEKA